MINSKAVRVQDIILDETHPRFRGEDSIGTILYTELDESTSPTNNQSNTFVARPLYRNISYYPVANELVYIVFAPTATYNETQQQFRYYLPPINVQKSPTSNALPNLLYGENDEFYQGQYFEEQQNIRPLRPYEGDIIFEGRFGNSIRLGSTIDNSKTPHPNPWSNEEQKGNPITIIRNGQSEEQEDVFKPIIEDINNDNTSIYLCSNQQITNFIPASINDASYGTNIFDQDNTEEKAVANTDISSDTQEDIVISSAANLPPEELQVQDDLSDITDTEVLYYDDSPTENQAILSNNDIPLQSNYEVPDTININQELGNLPPNGS